MITKGFRDGEGGVLIFGGCFGGVSWNLVDLI